MTGIFGLDELTVADIPNNKPCFALIFDFPYEINFPTHTELKSHSLPQVPLVLEGGEKYELDIDWRSWLRLLRAYGGKDKWVGKPVLLEVKKKTIQAYPVKAVKLRYNWSFREWWWNFSCEIRVWIDMNIIHRHDDEKGQTYEESHDDA